jgi:predicted lipoprotein with Yx(FWY)xxD motif
VIAAALLAAACGSSSSSSSSASAPSAGSAAASTPSSASSSNGPYSSGGTSSSASASSSAGGTKVTTKQTKLGTVLAAGPKQLTVYMFEADKGSKPACTGACAAAWPPVTASGAAVASGKAVSADLGTTTRPAGVKQVTYKGHPLYYFIKDKDDGDSYGQGVHAFGAGWYVVAPSGNKVDNS